MSGGALPENIHYFESAKKRVETNAHWVELKGSAASNGRIVEKSSKYTFLHDP